MFWICLIIITSAFTGESDAEVPTPVVSILSNHILEGDTIILKCGYSVNSGAKPVVYVIWHFNFPNSIKETLYVHNVPYPPTIGSSRNSWRNRSIGVEVSDGFQITLKNVTIADSHHITCDIADNGLARQKKTSAPVSLIIAVEPSGGILQSDLTATADEPSTFECVVSRAKPGNSIDIAWFFNGNELLSDITRTEILNTVDNKTYTVKSKMTNTYTAADDGKKLSCNVKWTFANRKNQELISTDEGTLKIHYPPFWTAHNNILYAEKTTTASLECLVKSNPPIVPSLINWYVVGSNRVLSTGERHVLNMVSNSDFRTYRCEVIYEMQKRSFEVELMESGPPQLTKIMVLSNMTSRTIPLQWVVGSNGGHPPQTFTIYMKKHSHKDFGVIEENIEPIGPEGVTMHYDVKGLDPNTQYEFKIIAKNSRKDHFPEKEDTSMDEIIITGVTKKHPKITITNKALTSDRLTVDWDYNIYEDDDPEKYQVTLKIKYGKKGDSDHKFKEYPEENYIDVARGSEVIHDIFDESSTYDLKLLIYENGEIIQSSGDFSPVRAVSNDAGLPLLEIIVSFVAILVVIIAVFLITFFLCWRYRKNHSKGQKRYNDHYLLEKNIYEDIKLKRSKPPKLPNRNSSQSQKDDPIAQNNNITALQTVYLTQQISGPLHLPPSTLDLGISPYIPTSETPDTEQQQTLLRQGSKDELDPFMLTLPPPTPGEDSVFVEQTDYLVPLPSPSSSIPPVSMQITVNQNNSTPSVTYRNYDNNTIVGDRDGKVIDTNTESAYLPMGRSFSTLNRS